MSVISLLFLLLLSSAETVYLKEGILFFENYHKLSQNQIFTAQLNKKKCSLDEGPLCLFNERESFSGQDLRREKGELTSMISTLESPYRYVSMVNGFFQEKSMISLLLTFVSFSAEAKKGDFLIQESNEIYIFNEIIDLEVRGKMMIHFMGNEKGNNINGIEGDNGKDSKTLGNGKSEESNSGNKKNGNNYNSNEDKEEDKPDVPSGTIAITKSQNVSISIKNKFFIVEWFMMKPHLKSKAMSFRITGLFGSNVVYKESFVLKPERWVKVSMPNVILSELVFPENLEIDNISLQFKANEKRSISSLVFSNLEKKETELVNDRDIR